MKLHQRAVLAACAAILAGRALAGPIPAATVSNAVDLGAAAVVQPGATMTLTVALKLSNEDQLEPLVEAIHSPTNPLFGHFLTQQQFAAQFGPSAATVAQVTQHFQSKGFTVTRSATAQLQITGSVAAVEAEFNAQLHSYRMPAAVAGVSSFQAPTTAPTLDASIAGAVNGVLGLDTRPRFRPNVMTAPQGKPVHAISASSGTAPNTPDAPGFWTVVDFGKYYNVDPLYAHGITGQGQTIGIVTFASFTPSDALAYWKSLSLPASANRIRQVKVDGGSGPPSDAAGSVETTLDVEQSGGVAPGATVVVYEAPNTGQGFVDNFAKAVDQDVADTVSVSWGEWEYLDVIPVDDVTDPTTNRNSTFLKALNDLLLQAALQGQSVFCSAGDAGAYDANDPQGPFPYPPYSKVLSVDDPAAQTYITAAGGTTLAGPQVYALPNNTTYTVTIPTERAWGWDYLTGLCNALGLTPVSCGIFPAGGGGGVSSYVPVPFYQLFTPGITTTPYGQKLSGPALAGVTLPVTLPGGYPGRNVPDLSVNSDPDTGYVIWYTSSDPTVGFSILDFYGGTSFAAPELNGMTSLFNQALHHRLGLLNFALYAVANGPGAYNGPWAPLRDIKAGNNWYWQSAPGYDQATGLGVPNVANLLQALQSW